MSISKEYGITKFSALDETERLAIARVLAAIPVPDAGGVPRGILLKDILFAPSQSDETSIHWRTLVVSTVVLLEGIGAIHPVISTTTSNKNIENCMIYPSSDSAAWFIRSLSRIFESPNYEQSPIEVASSQLFKELFKETIDPHLLMANLLERFRTGTHGGSQNIEPLRKRRIISVLIKGRTSSEISHNKENVYLHIYKSLWGEYALIGAKQRPAENELQTARRALAEDLDTPPESFELEHSYVPDTHFRHLAVTHGAFTDYQFNLVVVTNASSPIIVRKDLVARWFTFEEIMNQRSRDGAAIMTNRELMKNVNEQRPGGLGSLHSVAEGILPNPVPSISIRDESKLIWREILRRLTTVVQGMFSWAILLLILCSALGILVLTPNFDIPYLNNVADIVGIVAFMGSITSLAFKIIQLSKKKKG